MKGYMGAWLKRVDLWWYGKDRLWIVLHVPHLRRLLYQLRSMFYRSLVSYLGTSGGGGGGNDSLIKGTMVDLLERLPENFEMITMQLRAKPLLEGEAGPFVVVALQVNTL